MADFINEGSALFAAGDLSVRVQVQSQDEFRHLGEQFNAMADEIASLVDAQRAQAQRLSGLLRNTPSGGFALDPHTLNCTFISPNAEALLGPAGHADPPDLEHLLGSIHPKDRATLRDGLLSLEYPGLTGSVSFRSDGTAKRTIYTLTVQGGRIVEISPSAAAIAPTE